MTRVAVIGVGHLGSHHARLLSKSGSLVAVVDADPKRAAEIAALYSVPVVSDYRELFDKVDGVTVAVPTINHFSVAKEFLERGIAAMVEKPLAASSPA